MPQYMGNLQIKGKEGKFGGSQLYQLLMCERLWAKKASMLDAADFDAPENSKVSNCSRFMNVGPDIEGMGRELSMQPGADDCRSSLLPPQCLHRAEYY